MPIFRGNSSLLGLIFCDVNFLIILRNQYDLIRSLYYHTYPEIIKFLKIKNFENLVNQIDDGVIDNINNFPLRLFLEQYDFNLIDVRLKELFKNSKVKYLFYEDLKYNKNIFIDEFCKFLNLDLTYTQNLFNDNDKIVNPRKFDKKNELVISPLKYKIINNKIFIALKNKIPFKEIFKSIFLKYFVYSKVEKIYDENRLKYIIKKYYKNSNRIFFKNIKINNKFDY